MSLLGTIPGFVAVRVIGERRILFLPTILAKSVSKKRKRNSHSLVWTYPFERAAVRKLVEDVSMR